MPFISTLPSGLDSARQFLSSSHPREKYAVRSLPTLVPIYRDLLQLFLKGTHLTQLSEEYQIAASNINKTYKTLQQKKTVIPELKNKRDQWMAKVREAKKAENLHHDLEKIKGELSWALVEEKRKVCGTHPVGDRKTLISMVGVGKERQRGRKVGN
jgi:hypothetical protein